MSECRARPGASSMVNILVVRIENKTLPVPGRATRRVCFHTRRRYGGCERRKYDPKQKPRNSTQHTQNKSIKVTTRRRGGVNFLPQTLRVGKKSVWRASALALQLHMSRPEGCRACRTFVRRTGGGWVSKAKFGSTPSPTFQSAKRLRVW